MTAYVDDENARLRREHLRSQAEKHRQAGLCPTCGREDCDTVERMRSL